MNRIEDKVDTLENKLNKFDLEVHSNLLPNKGIYFDGQIFDAYIFINELIKKANTSIILVDNYIDETVLAMLSKRKKKQML